MKLAILSDVHGNLPALQAVVDDLRRVDVDGILVAGDLVGGPYVKEAIWLLRSLGARMIRGNGETGFLRYAHGEAPAEWHTYKQFAFLRWEHCHYDREVVAYLESLPEQMVVQVADAPAIRVVHGSPRNPFENIFPDRDPEVLELALAQTSERVLICGHIHRPWKLERDGRLIFNPGAVSAPLNGVTGTQYALLTWSEHHWDVEHRLVSYDLGKVREAYVASGLLKEGGAIARCFLYAIETGRDYPKRFFAYARQLEKEAGLARGEVIPDAILEQATATFDWNAVVRDEEADVP